MCVCSRHAISLSGVKKTQLWFLYNLRCCYTRGEWQIARLQCGLCYYLWPFGQLDPTGGVLWVDIGCMLKLHGETLFADAWRCLFDLYRNIPRCMPCPPGFGPTHPFRVSSVWHTLSDDLNFCIFQCHSSTILLIRNLCNIPVIAINQNYFLPRVNDILFFKNKMFSLVQRTCGRRILVTYYLDNA